MSQAVANQVNYDLKPFAVDLLKEVKSCFEHVDSQSAIHQITVPMLIHLVSVGGLQIQDVPMSGKLQETVYLQGSRHLRILLRCFIPALARVYLVYQPIVVDQPVTTIYQSPTHRLFYQTVYISLENYNSATTDIIDQLSSLDKMEPRCLDSRYYLAIEVAKRKNELDSPTSCDTHLMFTGDELFNCQGLSKRDFNEPLKLTVSELNILSPSQTEYYLSIISSFCQAKMDELAWEKLNRTGQQFLWKWTSLYEQFASDYIGEYAYQCELKHFRDIFMPCISSMLNKISIEDQQTIKAALDMIVFQFSFWPPTPQRINRKALKKWRERKRLNTNHLCKPACFDRPIFIVSAPRAGSTLLFETLVQFKNLWSTGEENHALLENILGLHPKDNNFHSNRLTGKDANASILRLVVEAFTSKLQDREQKYYLDLPDTSCDEKIRFLEKTPKNALRIPFMKALFPDALFIYLYRDAKSNISSLIDGWRSQRFISYQRLPGMDCRYWSFLLIPGWREMSHYSISEIAKQQWKQSNQIIQDDLQQLSRKDWMSLDYHELINQPEQVMRAISQFADLAWDTVIEARCKQGLPVSRLTLSSPCADKWLKHKAFLD